MTDSCVTTDYALNTLAPIRISDVVNLLETIKNDHGDISLIMHDRLTNCDKLLNEITVDKNKALIFI